MQLVGELVSYSAKVTNNLYKMILQLFLLTSKGTFIATIPMPLPYILFSVNHD